MGFLARTFKREAQDPSTGRTPGHLLFLAPFPAAAELIRWTHGNADQAHGDVDSRGPDGLAVALPSRRDSPWDGGAPGHAVVRARWRGGARPRVPGASGVPRLVGRRAVVVLHLCRRSHARLPERRDHPRSLAGDHRAASSAR